MLKIVEISKAIRVAQVADKTERTTKNNIQLAKVLTKPMAPNRAIRALTAFERSSQPTLERFEFVLLTMLIAKVNPV
ncbi:MAG: hypothetical protein CR979_03960 [Propionibacterium sp.]|nr:MAG: hypothetical protein CR979_03960 [Propionibacterium sp.]